MCSGGYKGEMLGAGFEQRCFGAHVSLSDVFENVDVVVSPTCPSAAFAVGEMADDPLRMYQQDIFTTAANLAERRAACGLN